MPFRSGYITNQFNDQLPVGLIAQLFRALHRYRRGQGSNPGKPDFFRLSFRNCISCVNNCEDLLYIYLNWFLQISNLSSFTKAPLFPLEDRQTVLAQPTQRWAALLLSMKKRFTYSKKKCSAELWNKSAIDYHYKHLNWFLQISNLSSLTNAPLFPLEDGQTVLAEPTQRWAALLLSMKKWFTYSKKTNVVLNFETKVRQRLSLYVFKLTLRYIQSELIGTAHSRTAALLLSMKKWFTYSKKKQCSAELWNKSATETITICI